MESEFFNIEWFMETTRALARVPSLSGTESNRISLALAIANSLGLKTSMDSHGNGIVFMDALPDWPERDEQVQRDGELQRDGFPAVLLTAHADSKLHPGIPALIGSAEQGGHILKGCGCGDNCAAIAAGIAVMGSLGSIERIESIEKNGNSGNFRRNSVVLALTRGEEGQGCLRGAAYLAKRVRPDLCIALEGVGPSLLSWECTAVRRFVIKFAGETHHPWKRGRQTDENNDQISVGITPMMMAVFFLESVITLNNRDAGITVTVNRLETPGGEPGIDPGEVRITLELRAISEYLMEGLIRNFTRILIDSCRLESSGFARLASKYAGKVLFRLNHGYGRSGSDMILSLVAGDKFTFSDEPVIVECHCIDRRHAVSLKGSREKAVVISSFFGSRGRPLKECRSSSDATAFSEEGISAVMLGLGRGGMTHSHQEWICLDDVMRMAALLRDFCIAHLEDTEVIGGST
ncbi:MAG: hypothetical protein CVV64_09460 [Candidatus Wallbacteria bacterium HGW-Wallbacteria-1]|jgi:acetylornithine deacetylase/succinyl-diaminopimelate desuccinylase-like protein|uniref:Peptidase M20 dimerisation domain-containing protein n=1 Tax=Candidatus Wallbacteria bacterium HGW-Wallbacteria-1 TaxID=2013854 RepID=A0A2N1PQG6_9BACT|nr:MAG: hypothetical protein CVV64_09460 [Candidatus Wallbacteria bacterium HGW-Wallbacteria-1]